jgi:hypothetical protein
MKRGDILKYNDLKGEIPQRAYINAQIIQEVQKSSEWNNCIDSICKNYGLNGYQFFNPAYIVSLMYCLLVVPKELWIESNKSHYLFENMDESIVKGFKIVIYNRSFNNNYVYNLLHKLRNSVAHANYAVNEEMTFTFWDEYKGRINFEATISKHDLMSFITKMGSKLANSRVDK